MDTKQYLSQIERLDRVIQNKLTEIYQLKTMACNIVVSTENERVQTSGDKERMASTVAKIVDIENDITYVFGDGNPGPKSTELYNRLRAIQLGEAEDRFGWCTILDI